jgi:hypothetical protein
MNTTTTDEQNIVEINSVDDVSIWLVNNRPDIEEECGELIADEVASYLVVHKNAPAYGSDWGAFLAHAPYEDIIDDLCEVRDETLKMRVTIAAGERQRGKRITADLHVYCLGQTFRPVEISIPVKAILDRCLYRTVVDVISDSDSRALAAWLGRDVENSVLVAAAWAALDSANLSWPELRGVDLSTDLTTRSPN